MKSWQRTKCAEKFSLEIDGLIRKLSRSVPPQWRYRPESAAQPCHAEPAPTDMHTYLSIYPYVGSLLYGQAYLYEPALLCGGLHLYLDALRRG